MDTGEKIALAIVMPVYNQGATIKKVIDTWIERLAGLGVPFRFHVYNDGSTDDTPDVLHRLADMHPALCIHNKKNTGHGPTILQGYRAHRQAEWIFQLDSDDEVSARWFEAFWRHRHAYDFVIANRQHRHASFSRRCLTGLTRGLIRILYGRGVRDVNAPYRLLRTATCAPCFAAIPENTFAPNVLLTSYALSHGVKILEIDVPHQRSLTGSGSVSSLRLARGALRSLWQTLSFRFIVRNGDTRAPSTERN